MALSQAEKTRRYRERMTPERREEVRAKDRERSRSYYARNKNRIKASVKVYAAKNTFKVKESHRRWYKDNYDHARLMRSRYWLQNPLRYLIRLAKKRAIKRGIEFSITVDDVSIPDVCPLLGIPIEPFNAKVDYRPSIDRLDSRKGYIPGNVLIISQRANRIKSDATPDEIMTIATNLVRIMGGDH